MIIKNKYLGILEYLSFKSTQITYFFIVSRSKLLSSSCKFYSKSDRFLKNNRNPMQFNPYSDT